MISTKRSIKILQKPGQIMNGFKFCDNHVKSKSLSIKWRGNLQKVAWFEAKLRWKSFKIANQNINFLEVLSILVRQRHCILFWTSSIRSLPDVRKTVCKENLVELRQTQWTPNIICDQFDFALPLMNMYRIQKMIRPWGSWSWSSRIINRFSKRTKPAKQPKNLSTTTLLGLGRLRRRCPYLPLFSDMTSSPLRLDGIILVA